MNREAQKWCKVQVAKSYLRVLQSFVLYAAAVRPAELGPLGFPKKAARLTLPCAVYAPDPALAGWLERAHALVQSESTVVATMRGLEVRKLSYRALPDSMTAALRAALALLRGVLASLALPLALALSLALDLIAASQERHEPERSPPRPPPLVQIPAIHPNAPNAL